MGILNNIGPPQPNKFCIQIESRFKFTTTKPIAKKLGLHKQNEISSGLLGESSMASQQERLWKILWSLKITNDVNMFMSHANNNTLPTQLKASEKCH